MPNVKIYVDEAIYSTCRANLAEVLGSVIDMLCHDLTVERSACQMAVLPVLALPGLPALNVEVQIMPRPDRTRDLLMTVCTKLRDIVGAATGSHVAIRVMSLNPETYIALK